jgi:hypothetical protein
MLIVVAALGGIIFFVVSQGISSISWTFLTDIPRGP